jgi:hypothetical protein
MDRLVILGMGFESVKRPLKNMLQMDYYRMAELQMPLVLLHLAAQQLQSPHEVATTRNSSPFRVGGGFSPLNSLPTMELSFNHRSRRSAGLIRKFSRAV